MSDTDDTNRAVQMLQMRAAEIRAELEGMETKRAILDARMAEVSAAIEIVA